MNEWIKKGVSLASTTHWFWHLSIGNKKQKGEMDSLAIKDTIHGTDVYLHHSVKNSVLQTQSKKFSVKCAKLNKYIYAESVNHHSFLY